MTLSDTETVVEYCVHNVTDRRAVESLPAEIRGYPCLERCGRCRRTPFLIVDGDLLEGPDHAALAERVREGVE
jgi:uncharacterized protein YuzB (UPF0349 family)